MSVAIARPKASKRGAIVSVLAIALLALGIAPLLTILLGAHAPGWAAWVCSHTLSGSIRDLAPSGRLGAAFRTSRNAVAVHWPHLIPIPLALATLAYLCRQALHCGGNTR
jgi:hypothetical protein